MDERITAEKPMLPDSARTTSNDNVQENDSHGTSLSTLLVAFVVIILGMAVVDTSRLLLILIPVSFLAAAYGTGLCFEQAVPRWRSSVPGNLPFLLLTSRLGIGIAVLGLSTTILGLLSLYQLTGLLILSGLVWSVIEIIRTRQSMRPNRFGWAPLISGLVLGSSWLIAWLWCTIPPTFYDELAYHLPIAQYAVRTGSIPALPWSFFTFMPHLSDLLLGWGLVLAGDLGARAMHFAIWIAAWIAGMAFVEGMTAPTRTPWLAFVVAGTFASSSMMFFLGTLPFSETSLTFAVLASAALVMVPATSTTWLPVGLLWGLAISVKLSGLSWVVAGSLAAFALGWPIRSLAMAWGATLLMAIPWWGRAWWLTGNPLYPMGYRWLGGRYWNDEIQGRLQGDLPSLSEPFNVNTLLRLPYDMVMSPEQFGSASDCGVLAVIAVCLMLSLPLCTIFWTIDPIRRRQCYAAGLFAIVTIASWIMTSTTTRFLAPTLMLGLSIVGGLILKAPKPVFPVGILIVTTLGLWGTSRFVETHSQVFSSKNVALGQESGPDFAARTIDHFEAAIYVRDHIPSDAKLLFIGESRPYYFNRPSLSPYPYYEHPLTRWVSEATSPEQLRAKIRDEGFTYVILNTREFSRLRDQYQLLTFTGPDASQQDQRLKQLPQTMNRLFSKHNVYVFEIPTPSR